MRPKPENSFNWKRRKNILIKLSVWKKSATVRWCNISRSKFTKLRELETESVKKWRNQIQKCFLMRLKKLAMIDSSFNFSINNLCPKNTSLLLKNLIVFGCLRKRKLICRDRFNCILLHLLIKSAKHFSNPNNRKTWKLRKKLWKIFFWLQLLQSSYVQFHSDSLLRKNSQAPSKYQPI